MIAFLVALSLAAAPKAKPPKAPPPSVSVDAGVALPLASLEQAGEVKEIELDEKRARAIYQLRTAISIPVVVEFPEPLTGAPACGDCADALKPGASSALFALQVDPTGNYLVIKPRLYPGIQPDGSTILASDFVTTVTVRMQSLTITLRVELTEDKRQADPRVRFVLPNRSTESKFVTESIAKYKAGLDTDFAAKVEGAASEALLRHFLEPHECRSVNSRQRADDIVLELRELCRYGRRLYVRFVVENRGRSLFVIGELAAGVGKDKTFEPIEARSLTMLPEVAFQQASEGVVSFEVEDPTAHSFELRAVERGGRTRTVSIQGFSF